MFVYLHNMLTEICPLVWFEVVLAQWRSVWCVSVCVYEVIRGGCDGPRDQG